MGESVQGVSGLMGRSGIFDVADEAEDGRGEAENWWMLFGSSEEF